MFVGVGAARVRDLFTAAAQGRARDHLHRRDRRDRAAARRRAGVERRARADAQPDARGDGRLRPERRAWSCSPRRTGPRPSTPRCCGPGRFDRQVEIPLPNLRERTAILAVHARDKHLERRRRSRRGRAVDARLLRRRSREPRSTKPRSSRCAPTRDTITAADFSEARDRILLGRREATNALMPGEKHAVAVHESGHALVAALSPNADPVAKVTILPAGQALGVTEQLPADERHLYSESYLKDSLAVRLGGRAAELLVLGEASSGASSDLAGATDLATRMVREYGMSERLGPVGFASGSPMYLGTEQVHSRDYAEATQRVIDEEVSDLLREAEQRALTLLSRASRRARSPGRGAARARDRRRRRGRRRARRVAPVRPVRPRAAARCARRSTSRAAFLPRADAPRRLGPSPDRLGPFGPRRRLAYPGSCRSPGLEVPCRTPSSSKRQACARSTTPGRCASRR